MPRILDTIAIGLLILLGLAHLALTPVFARGLNLGTLWFAGSGLAVLFLGLINEGRRRSREEALRWICLAADLLGLAWAVLAALMLRAPQAWLAVLATAGALAGTLFQGRREP